MGEFFGSIYCIFEDFFGLDLAEYLWGDLSPHSTTNRYIGIGFWMLGISLVVCLVFYYLIDHPKLNRWWCWLIALGVNGVINFFVGRWWVLTDYYDGKMVEIDPISRLEVSLNIGITEILCFGVTNMVLSIFAFSIFSLMFKWWSKNCSTAPF